MKKTLRSKFIYILGLGFMLTLFSACADEPKEVTTEEEGDKMLEEIQQSEKEKSDSVLNYWKNKTQEK